MSTANYAASGYRADIDGLRAIAVLSVVIYHALPEALPGGFIGVDIFFVISGFLITGILVREADHGQFSLAHFYERRIRRILPALTAVVLTTLVAGYLFLHPGDFRDLGQSAMWTMGFIANFYFWLNTGYFDAASESMPLLHMWSLAVEEQFYLLWPFVVLALCRWLRAQRLLPWIMLSGLLLGSFAVSVHLSVADPQAAFYLPWTRAWELGIGAALAFLPNAGIPPRWRPGLSALLSIVGLGLIAFGVTQLESGSPFPGTNALYPAMGSALLIFAGGLASNAIANGLGLWPMRFVGKISYSLYLWHWPVFVFYRHFANGEPLDGHIALALITLSILLAVASWRFIEQPLRFGPASRRRVFTAAICTSGLVAGIGLMVMHNEGLPNRIPPEATALADHKTMWTWPCPGKQRFEEISNRRCYVGKPWDQADRHALLWGDSHALHYAPLIDRIAARHNMSVLLFDSCPPYIDNQQIQRQRATQPAYSQECGREHREIMALLESDRRIELVIMASAWSLYPDNIHAPDEDPSLESGLELMRQGLQWLVSHPALQRRDLLLITEVPQPGTNLVPCVLSQVSGVLRAPCQVDPSILDVADVQQVHGPVNAIIHHTVASHPHARVVDATSQLCGSQHCSTFLNGEFLYRDTNHLRRNLNAETQEKLIHILGLEEAMRR